MVAMVNAFIVLLLFCVFLKFNVFCQVPYQQQKPKICTIPEFQKCMKLLRTVSGNDDTALPTNGDELAIVCSDVTLGIKCFDRHMRTCFTPEQSSVYQDLVSGARIFIDELCYEGYVQTEFLKYASCYRNISIDESKCATKYSTALAAPSSGSTEDSDTVMKRSCCALREFVHCKLSHVGRDCGEKAENFMAKHLSKITNPITERHCSAYTYGSQACRLNGPNSASSNLRNQILFAVLPAFVALFVFMKKSVSQLV